MMDSHFQVQLTAVLDVLMKSAVTDICALVESWFQSVQTEIARSKKENEDLRQKLHIIQQQQQQQQQQHEHQQQQAAAEADLERKSTKVEEPDCEVRDTDDVDAGCTVFVETPTEDLATNVRLWSSASEEQRKKTTFCHICVKDVDCLKSHLEWHNQKCKCHICHKVFYNSVVFSRHLNMHTGTKHACDVCRKTFGSKSGLLKHTSHHKGDLEKCKDCGQEFPTKQTLYTHREKVHAVPKKCPFCHLAFSRNSNLKKHLKKHSAVHL